MGAWKSKDLGLGAETLGGVHQALEFLRANNLEGRELARGKVGVIGGGNSAVDAARVARRQQGVESVTILYRRTPEEMPAFAEEVQAAFQEGIRVEPLTSPLRVLGQGENLTGLVCLRNRPGKREASGRRKPVPLPGSEFSLPLDTLIVAVGEEPEVDHLASAGVDMTPEGTVRADSMTLQTSRPGVFAGGDLATGPGTVVEAVAAGKRAALMIDRYLKGEELRKPVQPRLPAAFLEGPASVEAETGAAKRAKPVLLPAEARLQTFAEVEACLAAEEAGLEAGRCLRCDLEFTRKQ
jgi:NADPH-dependent glutamate synthase beta subunit-like oxidoreductase